MTIRSKQFEFLNPVLTFADLEIPAREPGEIDGQYYEFKPGDMLQLFNESKRGYSIVRFKEWMQFSASGGKLAIFVRTETSEQIPLSNCQISKLEKAKRICPASPEKALNRLLPGSSLMLHEEELAVAKRAMEYVDAVYREWEIHGTNRIPKEATMRVLQEVANRRGEPRPGYTWIRDQILADENGTGFDRLMNFVYETRVGNQTLRFPQLVYDALQEAVWVGWSALKGTWKTVAEELARLAQKDERFVTVREHIVDELGRLKIGRTTIQTRFAAVDFYTRDLLRFGPEKAAVRNRLYLRRNLPFAPLDIVDVDYTTVDVVVYDEKFAVAFGRPHLLAFRDRATGVVLGRSISFSSPSFASYLEGLEHAIFEKDPAQLPPGCTYPWWGMFRRQGVDNALEFLGDSIEAASKVFGFQIVEYRPAEPWLKGALEHMFSTFNEDLFHGLPGTTMSSPEIRDLFDDGKPVAVPVISLGEMRGMLDYYLARHYHYTPRQGLHGDVTTWSGVPAELWTSKLKDAPRRPLMDRTLFARLGGETSKVTVQSDGVRWDGIKYFHPELLAIYSHSENRRAKPGREATKYKATRDPNNLGRIWVEDPYRKCIVECDVIDRDAPYARGLTVFQHRQIRKYQLKLEREQQANVDLLQAKQALHEMMMKLISKGRKKHDPATALARFYSQNESLHRRGRVIEMARVTADGRMDIANPEVELPPATMNASAIAKTYGSMIFDDDDEAEADDEAGTLTDIFGEIVTEPSVEPPPAIGPERKQPKRKKSPPKKTSADDAGHRDISDIAANLPDWDD